MHLFIGVNFVVFIEVCCKSGNTDYIVVLSVLTHQLHNFQFLYTLLLITAVFFQLFDDLRTVQWTNVFMHFYSGIVKEWAKCST